MNVSLKRRKALKADHKDLRKGLCSLFNLFDIMAMQNKRRFYLDTYGKSLTEFAKAMGQQVKVQRDTGELLAFKKDIYLCPLCIKNFFYYQNGEYFESDTFSDDHYPPESAGGTRTILVCKPCNDFYGRKMDFVLKEYLQSQAFLSKNKSAAYPLKFSYSGIAGNYKIVAGWQDGMMVKNVDFKKYPLIKQWLMDMGKDAWNLNIKISFPSEKLIAMALLRAAYLYCFANWGYDFAFSVAGKNLRDVLQGSGLHPLSNLGVFGDVSSISLSNGFYFINNPKKFQVFQAIFDIFLPETDVTRKVFVLIPGPSEEAWAKLANFKDWIDKTKASTKVISIYNDCVMKGFYTHYRYTWETLTTQ